MNCCCGKLPGTRPPYCSLLLCCSSSSDDDPEMLDTCNIIGCHHHRVKHGMPTATCTCSAGAPSGTTICKRRSTAIALGTAIISSHGATHVLVAADELLELRLAQRWPAAVPALDVDAVPVRLEVLPLLRLTGEHPGTGVYAASHAAAADRSCSCRTVGARLCRLRCSCRASRPAQAQASSMCQVTTMLETGSTALLWRVKHMRRHLVAGGCCASSAAAAACDAAPTGFRASKKLSGKLYKLPSSVGIARLSKAVVGLSAHSYMPLIHFDLQLVSSIERWQHTACTYNRAGSCSCGSTVAERSSAAACACIKHNAVATC
jgi:hypothetical protein